MTNTKQVLVKARRLIDDPRHWTKGSYQGRRAGEVVYCAVGAIWHAAEGQSHEGMNAVVALQEELRAMMGRFAVLTSYNDSPRTTHEDILALYDRAIAAQQAQVKP